MGYLEGHYAKLSRQPKILQARIRADDTLVWVGLQFGMLHNETRPIYATIEWRATRSELVNPASPPEVNVPSGWLDPRTLARALGRPARTVVRSTSAS